MRTDRFQDTRGVSEVVGFVLVFSLVLGTITAVYVGGLAGLDQTRDAERINNAERAFDVMANNFQQMGRGDAPNRATEIKLGDAQLSTTTQRAVRVNASGIGSNGTNPVAIRYDAPGDASLVYEYGAVIREERDGAVMLREPDFLFTSDTVVIRFIELRSPDGPQGLGGSATTALVRAEQKDSQVLVNRGPSNNVSVSVETTPGRADVWETYLTDQLAPATTPDNVDCARHTTGDTETVTCYGADVDKLAVSYIRVDVTLT